MVAGRHLKDALWQEFAAVGKALASPKRLELLDLLAQGERSVEALARAAGLGVTSCSAHLQTLRHAGLVRTRRAGTTIHYSLAGHDVAALLVSVRAVAAAHRAEVDRARRDYLGGDHDVDHVSREDLLARLRAGDVVVVDVRPGPEYRAGHVPGAVSIPLQELAARLSDLPPDVEVVAYCRGAYCVLAHDAVRLLHAHGRAARRLAEGMLEWRLAGLPVATETG
jgi:rhodanese-related sulfurtransferase/DNA-binding transcriptional ArsR family regulator